jgi:hypothetical protein
MNISTKLEPATGKNGIEVWPATARTGSVLPVPGGGGGGAVLTGLSPGGGFGCFSRRTHLLAVPP